VSDLAPPTVIAAVQPLFEAEDVRFFLLTVEWWPEKLHVRVGGIADAEMGRRMRAYRAELDAWAADRQAGRDRPKPDHRGPEYELMSRLELAALDPQGAPYTWQGHSHGGTGTELISEWRFPHDDPSVPATVTLRASLPPQEREVVVRLRDDAA
jgi:hypothetical protein